MDSALNSTQSMRHLQAHGLVYTGFIELCCLELIRGTQAYEKVHWAGSVSASLKMSATPLQEASIVNPLLNLFQSNPTGRKINGRKYTVMFKELFSGSQNSG